MDNTSNKRRSLKWSGLLSTLILMSVLAAVTTAQVPVVLLDDDFEGTSWDTYWNDINSNWYLSNEHQNSPTHSASAKDNSEGTFTCDALDANDALSITVDFWYQKDDTEAADFALYYYNGTDYILAAELGTPGDYFVWLHYTDTVTDPQYLTSDFRIRFDASVNSAENVWVDDVKITKFIQPPDSDGDGVPDPDDNCPDDWNPLQEDDDLDDAGNACDDCPADPDKTEPGLCGCGVPDIDTDNDGTLDCDDGCPSDPCKVDPGICGCGIADTDADGDGILNCDDNCPDDYNPGQEDDDLDDAGNACDDCPDDAFKTDPGYCGCGFLETDTDNDGTPDCIDGCPLDPCKIDPGYCDCGTADTDTDQDGTPDCDDLCPEDPCKTDPGLCGCGTPDDDSDADGIPDCDDLCPMDPCKTEPGTCGCGFSDIDSDADGTPDCDDLCPMDPCKIDPGPCGCGGPSRVDFNKDGIIDLADLAVFLGYWMDVTQVRFYDFNLDADPGWGTQGQWAFGHPTGDGGVRDGNPDPVGGRTGNNVYGVNLTGDYDIDPPGGPYYLIAGPFNCLSYGAVELHFARWLNTDTSDYVGSTVEVSNNGDDWVLVWEHSNGTPLTDSSWQDLIYDIGDVADYHSSVTIRWGYEVLPGAYPYSGWNIDDVQLWGVN